MRTFITALLFAGLSLPALAAEQEYTNFRVGLGALRYDIHPGAEYMPDGQSTGVTLMAEFPQDNYHGSRFIVYKLNGEGEDVWGFETQMLLGYGLAQPGFRIHTGPAWHREFITTDDDGSSDPELFNGWGWQAGVGWQFAAITLELAATYRDPQDYRNENRRAGVSGKPDPLLTNLFVSYRF